MNKIVKEFALEHEDGLKAMLFFLITFALFLVAAVHAIYIKRSNADEMANLALESDTEQDHE